MNARTLFTEPDDELVATLAGTLSHTLSFTTLVPFDIDAEMAGLGVSALRTSRPKSWSLGGAFQHRLHVSDLTPGEARRLTDRLAALPNVAGAQVEHLISR